MIHILYLRFRHYLDLELSAPLLAALETTGTLTCNTPRPPPHKLHYPDVPWSAFSVLLLLALSVSVPFPFSTMALPSSLGELESATAVEA